jgi:hypothetical protein
MKTIALLLVVGMTLMGCTQSSEKKETQASRELASMAGRFVPVALEADTSRLSAGDRQVLRDLREAARIMDTLYLLQAWSGNLATLKALEGDTTPEGKLRLHYFHINMGPWSGLDASKPFVPGVPPKPAGANFYPEDMTKEEFSGWVQKLPEAAQKNATGFFTVIRRTDRGDLTAVPYNQEYRDLLGRAAALLRSAAEAATQPTLKTFLLKRADAFLSNDYYESDVAWMDLDSPIEPTIGPYEVYLDGLFNYKAAFEAFITIRNDEETAKLAKFSGELQEIERNLPIADRFKNPKLGAMAPIRVVDQVAIGGEARAGVQTAAFNLPNDEKVVAEKGSKRVMLRNVQRAKFDKILKPIAGLTIDPRQQPLIAFEPFFTHILAHELMHGLGPHMITVKGRSTTVRKAMKDLGSALEEAKADVAGLFALQYLIDKGVVPRAMEQQMYVTFLASAFRSLRFGIHEAHGRGMALQLNYFLNEKAFLYNESTGTFSVDVPRARDAARKLTGEIMTIQATGDYEKARMMLNSLTIIEPPVQRTLERLASFPVDIKPAPGTTESR